MIEELLSRVVPPHVKKLQPYQSARRIGGDGHIWLNANELEQGIEYHQLGAVPCSTLQAHRYPDFLPHQVAEDYLAYCAHTTPSFAEQINIQRAVAVRGADEAIDLLVRTFCYPNQDKIMICPPTYGMYEFCADAMAVETLKVPLNSNFQLDLDNMLPKLEQVNLIFLCSPNNPTGNTIKRQDIEELLESSQNKALVVVDEAYIEFEPKTSVIDLMKKYPHLMVIRTLSKAFGLASSRCGFLVASPEVMDYIVKVIPPYPMADVVAQIAQGALCQDGIQFMQEKTQQLIEVRDDFIEKLKLIRCVERVYPSATNFVLIQFKPNTDAYTYLLEKGIVTRNQSHEEALKDCVRITIGEAKSMQEILSALALK